MSGLFDTLFGNVSNGDTTQKSSGSSTTSTDQTTQTHGTSSSTTNSSSSTSTLDPATIALLQGLTKQYAGQLGDTGTDAASLRDIAGQLVMNAKDTSQIDNAIGAAQSEAERKYNQGEGVQIAGFQQQIGSKGNTFSQLLQQSGSSDLQSQLMNIVAQSKVQEQQNMQSGLSAAANVYQQAGQTGIDETNAPLNRLMSIMAMLKGAQTDTSSTSTTNSVEDLLQQLNGTSTTNTSGTVTGNQNQEGNTGGGFLGSLFG